MDSLMKHGIRNLQCRAKNVKSVLRYSIRRKLNIGKMEGCTK